MEKKQLFKRISEILTQSGETQEVFDFLSKQKLDAPTAQALTLIEADYENLKSEEKSDSIRLNLQYYFSSNPDFGKVHERITLKDITELQRGMFSKNLKDTIMSLCGLIAIRENNMPVAKKWFEKIANKDMSDQKILDELRKL